MHEGIVGLKCKVFYNESSASSYIKTHSRRAIKLEQLIRGTTYLIHGNETLTNIGRDQLAIALHTPGLELQKVWALGRRAREEGHIEGLLIEDQRLICAMVYAQSCGTRGINRTGL